MRTAEHTLPPEDIMAYLDGELQPDRASTVQAHLAQCTVCQRLASELRHISGNLASWKTSEPSETLSAPHAIETVRQRGWFPWGLSPARTLAFAGGAAALILVTNIWFDAFSFSSAKRAVSYEPAASPAGPVAGGQPEYTPQSASAAHIGGGGPRVSAQTAPEGAPVVREQRNAIANLAPATKIVRTANLTIVVNTFETIRPGIDRILADVGGFIGQIQASDAGSSRSLHATLRVPATRLDDAVRSLGALGRVIDERQSGDDVTEQVQDLEARLTNGRNTERRLSEVLKNRTGDVGDVLQVEREIARVREEIERLDAQRLNLERRVTYATVTIQVTEQRQATLDMGPLPVGRRLRNAFVDGLRQAYESGVDVSMLALRVGPVLLLWTLVLWWPVRLMLRTIRARAASSGAV